ncbi:MAG: hypothetical protein IJV34_08880, partial [Prevotella sp.]|nr:hypothetical protein [Prevotella sp.]
FKELFLLCLTGLLSCLAGAKVRTFSEPAKLFPLFFRFSCNFFDSLDKNQAAKTTTPYYIYSKSELYI